MSPPATETCTRLLSADIFIQLTVPNVDKLPNFPPVPESLGRVPWEGALEDGQGA